MSIYDDGYEAGVQAERARQGTTQQVGWYWPDDETLNGMRHGINATDALAAGWLPVWIGDQPEVVKALMKAWDEKEAERQRIIAHIEQEVAQEQRLARAIVGGVDQQAIGAIDFGGRVLEWLREGT
jgi:formylglycine-generating enzyme required for sulfatase activity